MLTWFANCLITDSTSAGTFAITDTKVYAPVVTLMSQDNTKLLEQSKSGLKRTINQSKYQLKKRPDTKNQYLDYFIDPSFQGVN